MFLATFACCAYAAIRYEWSEEATAKAALYRPIAATIPQTGNNPTQTAAATAPLTPIGIAVMSAVVLPAGAGRPLSMRGVTA